MSGEVEPLDRKEILATMKMLAGGQELIALLHSREDCSSHCVGSAEREPIPVVRKTFVQLWLAVHIGEILQYLEPT
jgi:hypothetical protein